jgi:hypothetical protein
LLGSATIFGDLEHDATSKQQKKHSHFYFCFDVFTQNGLHKNGQK